MKIPTLAASLLAAATLAAPLVATPAAHADEAVTVVRNARGEKVYRFRNAMELSVEAQLPRVIYYLNRTPVDYTPPPVELRLTERIHPPTTRPPF